MEKHYIPSPMTALEATAEANKPYCACCCERHVFLDRNKGKEPLDFQKFLLELNTSY